MHSLPAPAGWATYLAQNDAFQQATLPSAKHDCTEGECLKHRIGPQCVLPSVSGCVAEGKYGMKDGSSLSLSGICQPAAHIPQTVVCAAGVHDAESVETFELLA